jgi:hypothetical protein
VSTLSDPDSLVISLTIPNSPSMCTLIDSGSSHCFLDSSFVSNHKITTTMIPPIGLRLFDGTCNSTITQIAKLPITFPTGEEFTLTFYVTSLDSSCSALKINLEKGGAPPPGRMYSPSPLELEALRIFIDKNVRSGFIRPLRALHSPMHPGGLHVHYQESTRSLQGL